jgi:putative nucleotidyltransferase with HDIG domain
MNQTILFVDDEETILEVACEYFQQKGYNVIAARNGNEAVTILEKEKIDCCFTDINMPGMDGLQLAEHIRQFNSTIPVIIMTGYPSEEVIISTLQSGVVDFLKKPVRLDEMELSFRRVQQKRELFIENLLLRKEVEGKDRLERINHTLMERVEELDTYNRIMSDFLTVQKSVDIFHRIVDMAVSITRGDLARFYLVNEAMGKPFPISDAVRKSDRLTLRFAETNAVNNETTDSASGVNRIVDNDCASESLLMEIAGDDIPMLVTENRGMEGLPETIRSFMAVPMTIREKVFGVLIVAATDNHRRFTKKNLYYLMFMTNKAAYAIENLALYENIYENLFATLDAFVKAIEAKDPYTFKHSDRVTRIAMILGEAYGCNGEDMDILNVAGRLHDIGKIGVRDKILLKKGALDDEEFREIQRHPVIGADIVGRLGLWDREKSIIRHHHEHFDGSGYPDGLRGKGIPLLARILSVADAYDAMASDRIYRNRLENDWIMREIRQGAGTQFDPDIVNVFLDQYKSDRFHSVLELQ